MNPIETPRARVMRLPASVAALLALSAMTPVFAQTLANPSFEANSFTVLPGDITTNGGTPITGWTTTSPGQVGLNPNGTGAGSTTYANNGAVPNGANVAFIRAGNASGLAGGASLKTTASGLTVGTKYNVSFRVNARSGTTLNIPRLLFSTNGTGDSMRTDVGRVSTAVDATPYRYVAFEFTATATSQDITVTNERTTGDHTVLIDDFKIAASQNAWSYHAWTNDADSGIDSQYVYTHALNLGTNTPATINGVLFQAHEFAAERRLQVTGLTGGYTFGAGLTQIAGDSAGLAQNFVFGGTSQAITLQNLKPNTQYKFSLYGIGFDDPGTETPLPRATTFTGSATTDKFTVDLNHYGRYKGMVVDYVYTTDSLGSDVTINYAAIGADNLGNLTTFHTSAISNRETTPRTAAPTWTTSEWLDDATSGIDGTYKYTHAINLNSTLAPVVNGVVFTPLATGASTATYSNNMPSSVTDGFNNITGTSADLAKTFVYNAYPEIHKLTGLTPGKQYVVDIYSVGWDAPARKALIKADVGDGGTIVDQAEFGVDNGIRFEHTYTAAADGTFLVSLSTVDGATLTHQYAITNREATPLVNTAPTLTLSPVGSTLAVGDGYILRAGATGSPGMTYVWKKNGTVISGATGPTYEITNASASDVGSYTVTVTNGFGSATSTPVTIDVRTLALGNFSSGFADDGSALAGGAVDPHFKIITNPDVPTSTDAIVETGIPGAWLPNSGTSMWIGPRVNTAPSAAGTYVYRTTIDLTGFNLSTVAITGRWASDNAGVSLRVNDQIIAGQANDTGVTYGVFKNFSLNSTNATTLIAGVNNIDFYVNNETSGYTGLLVDGLKVVGTIPAGTAPHIVVQPMSQAVGHDQQVTLVTAANGSATMTYQWYRNDVMITGATDPTYNFTVDSPNAAGAYKVKVTNSAGNSTSNVANITVTANSAPVAQDYQAETPKNTALPIDSLTLLGNVTDADNDITTLTAVSATSSRGGTVTLSGDTVTYTPPTGFTGVDAFTYTVIDGWGGTTDGNVLVTVTAAAGAGGAPTVPLVVTLSGGAASGSFTGTPNATYTIQRSTDLVNWTDLPTVTASSTGAVQFSDSAPPAGKGFYRVVYTTP